MERNKIEGKGLDKCVWKNTLEKNIRGKGTSFYKDEKTEHNKECWNCEGYNLFCKNYFPENSLKDRVSN